MTRADIHAKKPISPVSRHRAGNARTDDPRRPAPISADPRYYAKAMHRGNIVLLDDFAA